MRILFVTHGFPPRGRWGTEFYTHQLVHGLVARGHEARVLHPVRDGSRPPHTLEEVVEDGVPVGLFHQPASASRRFEPSYRDAAVEACFAELLERTRPDLVHFTYLLWGLSVRLPVLARARRIPTVVTLTDYGLLCHRGQMFDGQLERCEGPHPPRVCARCIRHVSVHDARPGARLAKRLASEALALVGGAGRVVVPRDLERREACVREALAATDVLIAPTAGLARVFRRAGVAADRLHELVYAFDDAPYRDAARAAPPDPPRFGFLAQFAPHKGLHTLVEAARLLEARVGPAFEVVLHGAPVGGRNRLYAERVLARLPASVRRGGVFSPEEAPAVIAGLSALVLPSEWDENAPLSVLQARAAGVPVLGTDVPGIAEALSPEAARRLVSIGDARALADRMEDVLAGRIVRDPEPGLALALDDHLDQIEALYRRITRALG